MKKLLYYFSDLLLIAGFTVTGVIEAVTQGLTVFFFLMIGIAVAFAIQLQFGLRILGALLSVMLFCIAVYFLMAFFSNVTQIVPLSIHGLKDTVIGFLLIGSVIALSILIFVRNIRSRP